MTQRLVSEELLRKAIDAMTDHSPDWVESERTALVALRAALEQKTSPSDECLSQPAVKAEPIGEIVWDCSAYPWKRISCLHESDIAGLPIGTKVYTTPQAQEKS